MKLGLKPRPAPAEPAPPSAAKRPVGRPPPAVQLPPLPRPTAADLNKVLAPRGAELYGRMCAVCHGADGEGYKADQATALAHPDFLASVSDDFLRFAIGWGRRGTTMSAWGLGQGGPLSEDDVRAVIAHIRSWQQQPAPELELDESASSGDIEHGKALFRQHCERCHGPKAPYVRILNRQFAVYSRTGFLRQAIRHGRANTPMPGFEPTLGTQGVEDIVAYLRSLPSWLNPGEIPGSVPDPPIPLGPVPLNSKARDARGFRAFPAMTSIEVIGPEYQKKARFAILDARAPSDYMLGHIAGAVHVPFYDVEPYLNRLPKDAWIVAYCGCPHAESRGLAEQLVRAGFKKVTVLDEGFNAWIEKGYPVHKGVAP